MKKLFYQMNLMKRIKRLSITICLLYLVPSLFAQTIHGFGESPEGPSHPLNPKLGQPRIF